LSNNLQPEGTVEKNLTREEIEALLSVVADGSIDPDQELSRKWGGVVDYDLFSSTANKGLVPNLDIIYDSFIRYHRVSMSNKLRKIVEIKKIGARPYKFDDFLKTLPSPVCMGIYKIEPLKGASLLAMDNNLVFTIIDSILGGTGTPSIPENGRMFTSIELKLMQKMVNDALQDMEKAWAPLHATKMNLLRMDMNPRLVTIVPPEYQVITMELEIQIENIKGSMIFAVPYITIDPIRDKLKNGVQFDKLSIDGKWLRRLTAELVEAPVEVVVEMGHAPITLREMLRLEVGDTIMLDKDIRSDLVVKVGGVSKFIGVPGVSKGNKAVQMTKCIDREGEP
jgi:flagellar motor switch protein FliM